MPRRLHECDFKKGEHTQYYTNKNNLNYVIVGYPAKCLFKKYTSNNYSGNHNFTLNLI